MHPVLTAKSLMKASCIKSKTVTVLERAKRGMGFANLTDLRIENLIGAKDRVNKIELALQAELIHKLTSKNDKYCPKALVKSVIKLVGYSERLSTELKGKFNDWLRD